MKEKIKEYVVCGGAILLLLMAGFASGLLYGLWTATCQPFDILDIDKSVRDAYCEISIEK